MYEVVLTKVVQNKELTRMLLETENAHLEEGNTWGSDYWGTVNGKGKNKLGGILMRVRDEIRNNSYTLQIDQISSMVREI